MLKILPPVSCHLLTEHCADWNEQENQMLAAAERICKPAISDVYQRAIKQGRRPQLMIPAKLSCIMRISKEAGLTRSQVLDAIQQSPA